MPKIDNRSPKFSLQSAESELLIPAGTEMMGQRSGGVSMFSNVFKRGYGDAVFGSSELGIWLGAADFEDAPFSVDMAGNVVASSATLSAYISKAGTSQALTGDFNLDDGNVKIDGANNRILINDGTNDRILIGKDAGGF